LLYTYITCFDGLLSELEHLSITKAQREKDQIFPEIISSPIPLIRFATTMSALSFLFLKKIRSVLKNTHVGMLHKILLKDSTETYLEKSILSLFPFPSDPSLPPPFTSGTREVKDGERKMEHHVSRSEPHIFHTESNLLIINFS